MEGLTENKPLLYSLIFSGTAIVALASGTLPDVNNHFELVTLPDEVSTCGLERGCKLGHLGRTQYEYFLSV